MCRSGCKLLVVKVVLARTLNATDMLFHVCIHGYKWNPIPPIRWVADAVTLVRTAGQGIDWDRLVSQGQRLHLTLPLAATLNYLRAVMRAPVPSEAISHLQRQRTMPFERAEFAALSRQLDARGLLAMHWARHARNHGGQSLLLRTMTFPDHVRRGLDVDHGWQLPALAVKETALADEIATGYASIHATSRFR